MGNESTLKNLKKIGFENILISSITVIELIKGTINKSRLKELLKNIDSFSILNYNEEVSLKSVELIKKYHLSHNLHLADSIIAATSIIFNISLFTYNTKDFKYIDNLNFYKP